MRILWIWWVSMLLSMGCVCRKLRPFDPVTESLNVGDDGRAAMLFIDAVGVASEKSDSCVSMV
jgi:hypothetical protein